MRRTTRRELRTFRDPISREEARLRLERRYLEATKTHPLPVPTSLREYVRRNIDRVQEGGLLESYASRDKRRGRDTSSGGYTLNEPARKSLLWIGRTGGTSGWGTSPNLVASERLRVMGLVRQNPVRPGQYRLTERGLLAYEVLRESSQLPIRRDPRRRDTPAESYGSADFVENVKRQLQIGDRQIHFDNYNQFSKTYDSVAIEYVNLPKGVGSAGGGAERLNNRLLIAVRGFGRQGPHEPAPKGKVSLETMTTSLHKGAGFSRADRVAVRGKTATPKQMARYVADSLNKIAREVPPRYTHTTPPSSGDPRRRRRRRS
jgi:hypothetical protein